MKGDQGSYRCLLENNADRKFSRGAQLSIRKHNATAMHYYQLGMQHAIVDTNYRIHYAMALVRNILRCCFGHIVKFIAGVMKECASCMFIKHCNRMGVDYSVTILGYSLLCSSHYSLNE